MKKNEKIQFIRKKKLFKYFVNKDFFFYQYLFIIIIIIIIYES